MLRQFVKLFLWVGLVAVVLARFHVLLVRFFDPDEFAHLHWAWLISQGKLPYRDFFFYVTPLYQWFLWPLFKLPSSETVLLLARLWQFGLYSIILFLLYRITLHVTRHVTVALLTILLFITFPMTFDKTIDIRPDMLMTVLYVAAVERILAPTRLTKYRLVTIGALLGASFLTLSKIIYALPGALLLLWLLHGKSGKKLIWTILGFAIPIGLFIFYILVNGLLPLAWEAFAHTQFVVNQGKEAFSLLATLSPWPLVYVGAGGVSFPWLVNIGIWIAALFGLIILWKQNRPFAIFSGLFVVSAILFLALFPVPYVQYFIPLSVVASILAATAIQHLASSLNSSVYILTSLILLISFSIQYRERIVPSANNEEQLQVVRDVLKISKPTDTFYDMVGSYVFRPDGYFICCHPYAEFVDKLRQPIPTLPQSLLSNHTQFLIMDRTGLLFWKPKKEDLDFLRANYVPSKYPKIYTKNQ
ncbi:hypothetical protein HY086_03700 [Candidatus Gottesmanbacteria bacterium]|nr:hypothetical protein [Candidatus Gottesmanbacteria bacterium]